MKMSSKRNKQYKEGLSRNEGKGEMKMRIFFPHTLNTCIKIHGILDYPLQITFDMNSFPKVDFLMTLGTSLLFEKHRC